MSGRRLWVAMVCCLVTVSATGCRTNTCERLCGWLGEVSAEEGEAAWAECEAVCGEDYSAAGNYCRSSLHDLGQCVDGVSVGEDQSLTEESWSACDDELAMAIDDCGCTISECLDTCPSCDTPCAEEYGVLRARSATCSAIVATRP